MKRAVLYCTLAALPWPVATFAQAPTAIADPASASIHVGVLALDTHFGITNAGVDSNVFATAENPQRDVTATTSTGANIWLRTGRGMLMAAADTNYVHFAKFKSERATSTDVSAIYELRTNRLTPFAWGATRYIKDRPNEEITARVRHFGTEFGSGLDLRALSRTTARVEWYRVRSGFAEAARFDGHDLTELNQVADTVAISVRQRLTALTTFVARVSRDRNEFDHEPARNSESVRANAGFELGQLALIRGVVMVGYHDLTADAPALLPEFSGVTASVNVAYTAPTRTRIEAGLERELRQSYDPRTPHYTHFGWTGVLTQRVIGRWDVQLSGGRSLADYMSVGGPAEHSDFTDRVGGSIGYELANQLRASFEISAVKRTSELPLRDYRAVVSGFSVTYGY